MKDYEDAYQDWRELFNFIFFLKLEGNIELETYQHLERILFRMKPEDKKGRIKL